MRQNRTKARLQQGEVAAGIFVMAANPHVTGVIASAGFDFVHFDMEHTTLDFAGLEHLVRAADASGITPLVRVAGSQKRDILAALETGVQGIMVPAVESAEEAAEVVRAARYFPEGRRGMFYLGYASEYGGISARDHYSSSNREILVTVQIETSRGVENAAEIAAVPGVDALFIGPADLSQSLGIPGEWRHERVDVAIDRTIRAGLAAGRILGAMSADLEQAREWVERGVRFLATGLDMGFLKQALCAEAEAIRQQIGWRPGSASEP
jgi:4-hydroxy-2-oxoheptanedioate aldolase